MYWGIWVPGGLLQNSGAIFRLRRVEFEAGNYADARTYYGRAVDIEPAFDTYRYFYEEAGRRLNG